MTKTTEFRDIERLEQRSDTPEMLLIRERIVLEAHSWLGTPYHTGAMLKGVGCDCATFLLGVAQACGFALDEQSGRHVQDWFCHTKEERYLRSVMRHAAKVLIGVSYPTLAAKPGDFVLTRSLNSHVYNHGGIVVKWPRLIHAIGPKVCFCDASSDELWALREVIVFELSRRPT